VRGQIQAEIPDAVALQAEAEQARLEEQRKLAAEQARLEQERLEEERRKAAEQARLGEQRKRAAGQIDLGPKLKQVVQPGLGPHFLSTFPAAVKYGVAATTVLIVALVLYWALVPSPSNKQEGETQKQQSPVETANPTPVAPQQRAETQPQKNQVEATTPMPVAPQQRREPQKRESPVETA